MVYYYVENGESKETRKEPQTKYITRNFGIPIPVKKGYFAQLRVDVDNNLAFYELIETNSHKIELLKNHLSDTDYQAIKYAEGQITEEDYAPIKEQRQAWRDEINRLEGETVESTN